MTALMPKSSSRAFWAPATLAILLTPWSGGCSREEAQPTHEEIVAAEFEAILDLQDQACGGVSSFEKVGDLAYKVTCANGEVFRIHVSHEGSVNVATHTN